MQFNVFIFSDYFSDKQFFIGISGVCHFTTTCRLDNHMRDSKEIIHAYKPVQFSQFVFICDLKPNYNFCYFNT